MMSAPAFVDTRHGRFAYLAEGEAGAPLVLCLHGFPDHAPSYQPVLERLADAGYRAVAPWMRGYAPSVPTGPYHADQLGADAIAIADALVGDRPCSLVGHDWGAAAVYAALGLAPDRFARAVTMAVPHPLAFLTALRTQPAQLARSWYMFLFQVPRLAEYAVTRNHYRFIRGLWRTWSPGYHQSEHDWRALRRCLEASMPAPIEYYRALLTPPAEAARRVRQAAARPPITTPVLHLQGADDGCIAPAACRGQERYFAGEFASDVVPGVGHFLQLEDPDAIARRIVDWLG